MAPNMRRACAVGAAILLSPPLAVAAEGRGGMPQLDFANPLTTSQVVWAAIIFFILYLLVTLWALPQLDQVLAERSRTIADDLEAARAAKAEADAAVAELAEATRRARAEAQAAIANALARAKEAAAEAAQTFNARLEAQLAAAEQQIGEARSAAMGALRQVATETAKVLIRRLTGQAAPSPAVEAAVGTALAARRL